MTRRYPVLFILFLMLTSACASFPGMAQEDMTATPSKVTTSSENPSITAGAPLVFTDTPNPKFIPKQQDLIFIEFFAGT